MQINQQQQRRKEKYPTNPKHVSRSVIEEKQALLNQYVETNSRHAPWDDTAPAGRSSMDDDSCKESSTDASDARDSDASHLVSAHLPVVFVGFRIIARVSEALIGRAMFFPGFSGIFQDFTVFFGIFRYFSVFFTTGHRSASESTARLSSAF